MSLNHSPASFLYRALRITRLSDDTHMLQDGHVVIVPLDAISRRYHTTTRHRSLTAQASNCAFIHRFTRLYTIHTNLRPKFSRVVSRFVVLNSTRSSLHHLSTNCRSSSLC
ncbi:hypothetical protein FRC03_001746 [Tulasnella sp. 419]|nr:hypothetical protein FRC03_001746 [Tulasnella sp. 419]